MASFPDALRLGGLFAASVEYREPFFGAGAIGFRVLRELGDGMPKPWINDRDYGITCLWRSVRDVPDELCARVREYAPDVDTFYRFRDEDGRRDLDPCETGFRKLVLHQTSFSGLGVKAGGPIGGRQQSSQYNVACRWDASRLCGHIRRHHTQLRRHGTKITTGDFAQVIDGASPNTFIYADPPYVEKGGDLYKYAMSEADHVRLAALLRQSRAMWVVSYDDHPLVRDLYAWARIRSVEMTYTTAIAKECRRKNAELIISSAARM